VRSDLTPSGQPRQRKETLMAVDEQKVAQDAAPFNIVLEARP